jgi:hypothetical protein
MTTNELFISVFGLDNEQAITAEAAEQGVTIQDYVYDSVRIARSQGLEMPQHDAYVALCKALDVSSM